MKAENQTKVSFGMEATVMTTVRAAIFSRLYDIAKEHRDIAKNIEGKDRKTETKEAMISILFAYTTLEAYINAVGTDNLGNEWSQNNMLQDSLESKWLNVSKSVATKKLGKQFSVFNKKREPFKSFLRLKTIREENLIHWKAEASEPIITKYNVLEDQTIAVFNATIANWACDTVKQMVNVVNPYVDKPLWE
jgi:hypothetical protein